MDVRYDSYVALGDSFTEGLDDRWPDGSFRGWADLVANALAARSPGFTYANLAVRGRRLEQIRHDQVPTAEAVRPDLLTLAAGGNDILGLRCDPVVLGRGMHDVLERLRRTGATVLVFTGFDARGRLPLGGLLAGRTARYNEAVRRSAAELDVLVVDLWTLPGLSEDRHWSADRLHLSTAGHRLVAAAVLERLGLDPDLDEPGEREPDPVARQRAAALRADLAWARSYAVPWVGRKLRGRSTGDLVDPKRPELSVLRWGDVQPEARQ